MVGFEDNGYQTPEEAAPGDIPPQFATVVGKRVDAAGTTVWLLRTTSRRLRLTRSDAREGTVAGTSTLAVEVSISEPRTTCSPKRVVSAGPDALA
jgi:hypothetical protein